VSTGKSEWTFAKSPKVGKKKLEHWTWFSWCCTFGRFVWTAQSANKCHRIIVFFK
jgi:hypothetical protein